MNHSSFYLLCSKMKTKCKLVVVSLIGLFFLLTFRRNMYFVERFRKNDAILKPRITTQKMASRKVRMKFKLDRSNHYGIFQNLRMPYRNHARRDVSLLTNMDSGRLRFAMELSKFWTGPLHFSIFVRTDTTISDVINIIDAIIYCVKGARENAQWHIIFPVLYKTKQLIAQNSTFGYYDHDQIDFSTVNCSRQWLLKRIADNIHKSTMLNTEPFTTQDHYLFYPMNVLVNVARRACVTEFFLVTDSDLVPSENLREKFVRFAYRNELFDDPSTEGWSKACLNSIKMTDEDYFSANVDVCTKRKVKDCHKREVYIIPTFEFSGDERLLPRTTKTLLEQYTVTHRAAPFYHNVYHSYAQTNHDLWVTLTRQRKDELTERAGCLYNVKWVEHYEPFFIAKQSVPYANEIFSGYAYTKISYVTEIFAAGYHFKMMSNAFLIHRGWKMINSEEKFIELRAYGARFYDFLRRLEAHYNVKLNYRRKL